MGLIQAILNQIQVGFRNDEITGSVILSVLVVVAILALYEFLVYQVILHRSLYNKAFNICIAILPFFISNIILCLQSSMVVTLGTIGALAIIRFRTAVKDPVDLVFVLWSIFIGITCGCKLYAMAILTSIVVTIILVVLNKFNIHTRSHILVVHTANATYEERLTEIVKENCKRFRIKSKNYTDKGMDYIYEIILMKSESLAALLEQEEGIERFSLMEYDSDDVL